MKFLLKYLIIVKMQYKLLGKYIQDKRKSLGYTLNGFSIENDIDPAIMSRIENLHQNIKLNVLEKIAKGFNKTPAEFLTDFEKQEFKN
jgi:transcriptional regulator with XRE-family HTH domain